MKFLPAIDIMGGKCVRLSGGDYSKSKVYSENPREIGLQWRDKGIRAVHVVDLDGAKKGELLNISTIIKLREILDDCYMQVGGGIRSVDAINTYLDAGINKVIIGTKILETPTFIESIPESLLKKVIIDVAIKNNNLVTDGWLEKSDVSLDNFLKQLEKNSVTEIVLTDVSKDGMLSGVNIELIENILEKTNISVIASGGISSLNDIDKICEINSNRISGMIIGKAIYEGRITIEDLVKLSNK